ncbi:hypothetical protein NQ318_013718, partial [Aromia moschata]
PRKYLQEPNMPLGPDTQYNSNTFGIAMHQDILAVKQDSGIFPESQKNYIVFNIGRTEVYAELKYGTKVMWHGVADAATVRPGEWKELNNGQRPYYVTGLKVYNNTDERAVVHCATSDDKYYLYVKKEEGSFDEIRNKIIKSIVVLGLKYVPYVGSGLSGLVGAFWPRSENNVWEQVQGKIEPLVDEKILDAISGILNGDIRHYQERIGVLAKEIEEGGDPEDIRVHYMNIAQDLIGFEKKFMFTSEIHDHQNVNQFILPDFSTTVLMKISFYVIGMKQADKLGLTDNNVNSIKSYAERTIYEPNGANKYIEDLYKDRVDNAYKTAFAEDLYDNMMNGLNISAFGTISLEHLTDEGYYNDVISYSTVYGRQTARLIKEATAEEMPQPLTPSLVDGKRNRISSMDVYIWRIDNGKGPARIGGMKIQFENGDSYTLGTVSGEVNNVDFNGALLKTLEVHGDGAIDSMVFSFSDGRVITCGGNTKEYVVFELDKHHIVSIFLATDNWSLGGQAANISVAYQLTEQP